MSFLKLYKFLMNTFFKEKLKIEKIYSPSLSVNTPSIQTLASFLIL